MKIVNKTGTMKLFGLFMLVGIVMIAEGKYTSKYDNMNIMDVLKNRRLLHKYFNCVMERGPCTREGKELKKNVKEAMQTGCAECTMVQEQRAIQIVEYLIKHERSMWKQLTAKFDPTGEWRQKYEDGALLLSLFT